MTIIYRGNHYHIEYHRVTLVLPDVAGFIFVDTPVDEAGRLMGISATPSGIVSNGNTQAIGQVSLSAVGNQGGVVSIVPVFGTQFDMFRIFIDKQVGAGGNTNFDVAVMLWISD